MDFRERIEASRKNQDSGSIVSIINADKKAESEKEEILDFNFYGIENLRSQTACVDLRFADGRRKAIPYSYIMDIGFDAAEGIWIMTSTRVVKITGRDLGRLYDYLVQFRVKYVQANIGADLVESGVFVKGIEVEDM